MIHGFEFRYILLNEKSPSCIKEPQHEENNLVTVGSIGSRCDKASFDFPESSPCFSCFNNQRHFHGEIMMKSSHQEFKSPA